MSEYHHNYRAFGRLVLNSPEMVALMRAKAEKVMARAQATAPFDPKTEDHYRDHFSVSSGTRGGVHNDRAYGRVTNDSPYADYLEFGTEDTPRFATLRKALGAA